MTIHILKKAWALVVAQRSGREMVATRWFDKKAPSSHSWGQAAQAAWDARDRIVEERLARSAQALSSALAAIDASHQFDEMAIAAEEAIRQLEYGSIALLMNLTPLVADAARRLLEGVHFTAFLRTSRARLGAWHAGGQEYRFSKELDKYYRTKSAIVAAGPYGKSTTRALYHDLCGSVHGTPTVWNESRVGLRLDPVASIFSQRELWLHEAARAACYVILVELPALEIAGIDALFGTAWSAVQAALGLT